MSDDAVADAQRRADGARVRLAETLSTLKRSLLPRTLARSLARATTEKAADAAAAGIESARARPAAAAGVVALAAMFIARKSIARAISGGRDETRTAPARSDAGPSEGKP